jgi:hypothetical protein
LRAAAPSRRIAQRDRRDDQKTGIDGLDIPCCLACGAGAISRQPVKTLGFDVIASTPEQFAKQLQEDVERWGPVAKAASEEKK